MKACRRKGGKTVYFQYSKFQKGRNSFKTYHKVMTLELAMKRGYFCWGTFRENLNRTFHVGKSSTCSVSSPYQCHHGVIFAWGNFRVHTIISKSKKITPTRKFPCIQNIKTMTVGCIEDLRRFSSISAISRLGSRR